MAGRQNRAEGVGRCARVNLSQLVLDAPNVLFGGLGLGGEGKESPAKVDEFLMQGDEFVGEDGEGFGERFEHAICALSVSEVHPRRYDDDALQ
jgi:hypothetical protein